MIVAVVATLLRVQRRRLERAITGPFDARRSYDLDRVVSALEALGRA